MKIRKYDDSVIFEFDTLDELREFDGSYISDTRSEIIKSISDELGVEQSDIKEVISYKDGGNEAAGFFFECQGVRYSYSYKEKKLRRK